MKLHLLHFCLPLSFPLSAPELERSLGQRVTQELGQEARLLRWSLTVVEEDRAWAEVVATTD